MEDNYFAVLGVGVLPQLQRQILWEQLRGVQ